jgi:hypothetical protein
MKIKTNFLDLAKSLHRLGEHLAELRTMITEFGPSEDDTALVDMFRDPLDELIGRQEEVQQQALDLYLRTESVASIDLILNELTSLHQNIIEWIHDYIEKLACYENLSSLERFGSEAGDESEKWARIVLSDLQRFWTMTSQLQEDLITCWQALVIQASRTYISIQATNNVSMGPDQDQETRTALEDVSTLKKRKVRRKEKLQ